MTDDAHLYLRWLGDRHDEAFSTLARRHANLLYDIARRIGGDRVLAEDALQEALLALARDGTRRPAEVGVRAWLARRAISRARNAHASDRSRTRRERAVGSQRARHETDPDADGARDAVHAALAEGDGEGAALLSLRYLHELPYAEIAAIYDVREATARVRMHRALQDLRGRVRRDDLDEAALAGFLAALPRHHAPSATVDTAVATALMTAAVPPAVATATSTTVARAVILAIAALVVLTGVGLLALMPRRSMAPELEAAAEHPSPPAPPRLAGREPVAKRGGTPEGVPAAGQEPGKVPPPPATDPAGAPAARRRALSPLAIRLELVHPDGRGERIAMAEVWHRGSVWEGRYSADESARLQTRPGWTVSVSPADARAAFALVTAVVPDPVPERLTVRVPTKDDPRLDTLVVEVVDAATGAPIREAALEWDRGDRENDTMYADASGRIVVGSPPDTDEIPLFDFENTRWCVHAPGYRGTGRVWGPGNKEFMPAIAAAVVDEWLATGSRRLELQPLTADSGLETRSARILDANGDPATGITVLVVLPIPKSSRGFAHYDDGIRRPDRAGRITFPADAVVGLEARIAHVPIAAWCLRRDAWPDSGPRTLRLPLIAEAELTIEGLAEDAAGWWAGDDLGAKRTPRDGPAHPPVMDAGVAAYLSEHAVLLPVWDLDMGGRLEGPTSTIRLPMAVDRTHTLHLGVGHDRRIWHLQPDHAGPWRLTTLWEELPKP